MSWGKRFFLFKKILSYLAWLLQGVNILSAMTVIYFLLSSNGKIENFILTCSPLLDLI